MNKSKLIPLLAGISIILTFLLVGCYDNQSIEDDFLFDIQIDNTNSITKIFDKFNGIERSGLDCEYGQIIFFDFNMRISKGSLNIMWLDPGGKVVWQKFSSGNDRGDDEIAINKSGRYQVIVQGQGATGNFNIGWNIK